MMKNKGKLLLTLFLITWVIFALTTFVNHGHYYIGKSFFKSDNFITNVESFKEQLGHYVLEPFDAKEAKEKITVTQDEIEYHRNYYGTLPDQIENIRAQYSDRIDQAEQNGDKELKALIIKERDAKIADITENFSNDKYVEGKIRKQKEQLIDNYAAQQERDRKSFLNEYGYFAYSLTNIETGEKFESGEIKSSDLFSESFGNQKPYLTVDNSTYIDPYEEYQGEKNGMYLLDTLHIEGNISQFRGKISIPKSMLSTSYFKTDYQSFTIAKIIFYIIWATGILAFIGLFTVAKPSRNLFDGSNRVKDIFAKWPVDVRIVGVLIVGLIGTEMMNRFSYNIQNIVSYTISIYSPIKLIIELLIIFTLVSLAIIGAMWIWEAINHEEKLRKELKNAFLYRIADGMQDLFLNRTIGIQSVVILTIAFLAGVGFLGAALDGNDLVIVYIVLLFFIGFPAFIIFLRRMGYLNRIMKQTEDMAEGRLTTPIQVKGKSPLAKHATNLNELREGVRKSMTEQAKSERLKTELITNVSHDLRTPLTSIITYTELLKNPNITEEQRKQYIDVLDKKSARLKTLIEDLFEVSKMSSGNIELTKQRVDLTQLLQQVVGEHEEAFEKVNVDLRVTMPETPLFAYVDGQKWWRVIDNLVVNALKYSLEGTRVYATLRKSGSEAELTVKNISSYELSENVEELTERFKRADASRHTDGSGLGLAIAQSIVDLHGGRLKIEVDGDLFKVIVTVLADS